MKINIVNDFIGGIGVPNGINYEVVDSEKYPLDFYRPINTAFDYFYDKGYFISMTDGQIINFIPHHKHSTCNVVDFGEYVNEREKIYLYPIKISTQFNDVLGNNVKSNTLKSIFDFISVKALKLFHKENFYLYIEHTWEGEFDRKTFEKLYYYANYYNIPADKILIVVNTYNYVELHTKFLEIFPKEKKIKFCLHDACFLGKIDDYYGNCFNLNSFVDDNFLNENKPREKKALLLNRRLRLHRLFILSLLLEDGLLDKTLSSFSMDDSLLGYDDLEGPLLQRREQNIFVKEDYYIDKIVSGFNKLKTIHTQTLDFDNIDGVLGLGHETKELYEKTYFSIVTETMFLDDFGFVSEKVFKPILHLHPFVVLGSPNTLKHLKSYGFKTFDRWWDESYDSEEHHGERFKKIYEVITTLLNKSDEEWVKMIGEMTEVLIYNKNHMLSFGNMKETSNRIHTNLIKAIENEDYTKNIRLF